MPIDRSEPCSLRSRMWLAFPQIVRGKWCTAPRYKNQRLVCGISTTHAVSLQCPSHYGGKRNLSATGACLRSAKVSFVASLLDPHSSSSKVDPSPPKCENLPNTQPRHYGQQHNRTYRLI